jgi:large subunit ribosomal protein L4
LPQYDQATYRSFRNLPNVTVRTAPTKGGEEVKSVAFSARDLIVAHKVLIAQDALKKIEEVWAQ